MSLRTIYKDVKDPAAQESLKRLESFLSDEDILKGKFEFREFTLSSTAYPAAVSFPHKLLFKPRDIIETSVIGGPMVWEYALFTQTALVATIHAATVVRCFVGHYAENPAL